MSVSNLDRPVVVCSADKNMEAGLHVTLLSLLTNMSAQKIGVKIYLYLEGFSSRDLSRLKATLDGPGTAYQLIVGEIGLDIFKGCRSFHGSYMAYARLVLPEAIPDEERILYLDSDLVVGVDVSTLFQMDMENRALAAVGGGIVGGAMDSPLLLENGYTKEDRYFNSGVLLFDAAQWRREKITQQCLDYCKQHGSRLISHDQTVLNVFFSRSYLAFDERFNKAIYPDTVRLSPAEARNQVLHFQGSPKPWDLFGSRLHQNSEIFYHYFNKTALAGRSGFHPGTLLRTLRLARSYYKCIKALRRP